MDFHYYTVMISDSITQMHSDVKRLYPRHEFTAAMELFIDGVIQSPPDIPVILLHAEKTDSALKVIQRDVPKCGEIMNKPVGTRFLLYIYMEGMATVKMTLERIAGKKIVAPCIVNDYPNFIDANSARWYDSTFQYHRATGPAYVSDQSMRWFQHGSQGRRQVGAVPAWAGGEGRETLPAVISYDLVGKHIKLVWYKRGEISRAGGKPAKMSVKCRGGVSQLSLKYYHLGRKHRDVFPAEIRIQLDKYGKLLILQKWFQRGEMHRNSIEPAYTTHIVPQSILAPHGDVFLNPEQVIARANLSDYSVSAHWYSRGQRLY